MKGARKLLAAVMAVAIAVTGALLLTGCGSKNGSKTITNLVYNGEAVTWTRVLKAKHYLVSIDGGETKEVAQSDAPTISYAFKTEGDFSFSIEAVVKEGSDKNPTLTQQFTNIGRVTGLKVDSGKLVWNVVEAADGYELMENGTVLAQPVGVNEYPLKAGSFQYKVRAIKGRETAVDGNNGYYSLWSETFTGKVLEAPKNLKYDSETFTWEKVNKATGYVIKIGNEEFNTTEPKYDFVAGKDDFEVSVKAVGDEADNCYDSAFSEQKTYTYLERITSLNVTEGILVWDAVENAAGYKIRVDGMLQNDVLPDNKYDRLISETSYEISVLPIGSSDFYFSQWSPVTRLTVTKTPEVGFDGNAITWTSAGNAGGYQVEIKKGDEVVAKATTNSTTRVYGDYRFEGVGDYTVRVQALSNPDNGWYESRYSSPLSVKRLAAPAELTVTSRPEEKEQVSLSFSSVSGANGYMLKVNGTDYLAKNNGTSFSLDITGMTQSHNQTQVSFSVFAKGKTSDQGVVLDSLTGAEATVTQLATPSNFRLSGKTLSWDTVGTESYIVTIDDKRYKTSTASYTLPGDLAAGRHDLYVQAAGDRANVISSNYSDPISARKLRQPSNLRISAEGIVSWDTDDASAFVVHYGSEEIPCNEARFDLSGRISQLSANTLTQLTVQAVGNHSDNIIDSDESATGGIYKYAAPTSLALNDGNLIWNMPSYNGVACNKYQLVITKDGQAYSTTQETSSGVKLTDYPAGNYSVTVQALGKKEAVEKGLSTWDSEPSQTFGFTKLANLEKADISYEGKTLKWTKVDNATQYRVECSGISIDRTVTQNQIDLPFTSVGDFSVKITPMGTGNTVNGKTLEFKQQVKAFTVLSTDFTVTYNSDTSELKVEIKTSNFAGATGFKVVVNHGEREVPDNGIYTARMEGGQNAVVSIIVCGGEYHDGVFYIDSKSTEKSPA